MIQKMTLIAWDVPGPVSAGQITALQARINSINLIYLIYFPQKTQKTLNIAGFYFPEILRF
jgi:hypothetical protein